MKHRIFTCGTQTIDPIAGINTLRKRDERMQKVEEFRRGSIPPPPKQTAPRLALSWLTTRDIAAALRPTLHSPRFGTGQFSRALTAFIGGFQGYRVEMCNLTA